MLPANSLIQLLQSMKIYTYIIAGLAIAVTACSDDNVPEVLKVGSGNVLSASLPVEKISVSSRASIEFDGVEGTMKWGNGDALAVFSADGAIVNYAIDPVGVGKSEAIFKAPLDVFVPTLAVFPAQFVQSMKGNSVTMKLPKVYRASDNSQNTPMLGEVASQSVAFNYLSGIMRVDFANLPEGFDTIQIVTSRPISGTFVVEDISEKNLNLVEDKSANDHSNEVMIIHNGHNEPYYLPLPVGQYDEIHVYALGGKKYQLYDSANEKVECGKMLNVTKDYSLNVNEGDFGVIMNNILASNKSTPSASTIDKILADMNKSDGSFKGVSYSDNKKGGWKAMAHLDKLGNMVSAYIDKDDSQYYNNPDLLNAIEKALVCWTVKKPKDWNWWSHQVAEGKRLGLILVKMKSAETPLSDDVRDKVVALMKERCGHPFDKTGANRTDILVHWIYRACATEDKEVLTVAYHSFLSTLSYTAGEGFQMDGTFFQHGPQLYIGGYGEEVLKAAVNVASMFVGTSFTLPEEKIDIMSRFMRKAFFGSMRGKYMSYSVMGRSVSRPGTINKGYSAVLNFAKSMQKIDPKHAGEFQLIASRLQGAEPSTGVTGSHTHFYQSDYTLHIRPRYTFDIRMVSDKTCRVEYGNDENLRGYYMADGSTNILVDGDEYFDIMPVWSWSNLPGVTAPSTGNANLPMNGGQWGVLGTSTFAGGVSDGLYGVSAYSYNDANAKVRTGANKSWFCFDDEVVCLGSVSSSNLKVQTTVNQCLLDGEVWANDGVSAGLVSGERNGENIKWVFHDKVGYVFPQGGNIWVKNSLQRGSWKEINSSKDGVMLEKRVFSLGFNHLTQERASYAYVVVPGISSYDELEKYTAEDGPIAIVSNTKDVQSVYHKVLDNWQTVFFVPNQEIVCNGLKLSSDSRCAVMIKKHGDGYQLFVADPSRSQGVINIKVTTPGNIEKKLSASFVGSGTYAGESKIFLLN